MSAIGKYFSALRDGWNTPGFWSGELGDYTYIPDASEGMSDTELQTNYDALMYRLSFFSSYPAANSTEQNNLAVVVEGYTNKKYGYDAIIAKRQQVDTGGDTNTGGDTPAPASNNKWLLFVALGVGAVWYLNRKRKSKKTL